MIAFKNVTFTYDGKTNALDNLSFQITQGEFVCILGGNGSGKSTLAKHINALLVPDSGEVSVLDKLTSDEEATYFIRSHAGMVFQNPDDQLVASLVENDVAFGPENLQVPSSEIRERVDAALAEVGLQGFEKRETATLSGGQKQRVALAGALAMKPSILILDEATSMLDPRGRKGLRRLCKTLNERGITIVMITHFMEEAAQADRVIVLDRGAIACDGTPQEILVDETMLARLHLTIPFEVELSQALRARGVDIPLSLFHQKLKEELCALLLKA